MVDADHPGLDGRPNITVRLATVKRKRAGPYTPRLVGLGLRSALSPFVYLQAALVWLRFLYWGGMDSVLPPNSALELVIWRERIELRFEQ